MKNIKNYVGAGLIFLGSFGLFGCDYNNEIKKETKVNYIGAKGRNLCREMVLLNYDWSNNIKDSWNYNDYCDNCAKDYNNFLIHFAPEYFHLDSNKKDFLERAENLVLEKGINKKTFRNDLAQEYYESAISMREGKNANIKFSDALISLGDSLKNLKD